MSEPGTPKPEMTPQEVSLDNVRFLDRLQQLNVALNDRDLPSEVLDILRAQYGDRAAQMDILTWGEFSELCNRLSLRPESLVVWDDDYFNEQFVETVRIAAERRSFNIDNSD